MLGLTTLTGHLLVQREVAIHGWESSPCPHLLETFPTIPSMTSTMPPNSPVVGPHSNYQTIFDSAFKAYKKKTGKDLPSTPLFRTLETCRSSGDVIATLRQQVYAFDQSGNSNDGLTRWLDPTVKVVNAFSATIGGAVGLVSLTEYGVVHPEPSH